MESTNNRRVYFCYQCSRETKEIEIKTKNNPICVHCGNGFVELIELKLGSDNNLSISPGVVPNQMPNNVSPASIKPDSHIPSHIIPQQYPVHQINANINNLEIDNPYIINIKDDIILDTNHLQTSLNCPTNTLSLNNLRFDVPILTSHVVLNIDNFSEIRQRLIPNPFYNPNYINDSFNNNVYNFVNSHSEFLQRNQENEVFENLLNYLMVNDTNKYGTPPASIEAIKALKRITVTEDYLNNNSIQECNKECSICKENLKEQEVLVLMPCEHIFHENCIVPWLESHNNCAICRFELQTNDEDYEERKNKTRQLLKEVGNKDFNFGESGKGGQK